MRLFTFNREIADRLGPALARTPLTPNHLTTLALGSGLASGWLMAQAGRPWLLAGAFFLHLSFLLDNCDGAVARIKGTSSAAGMWYDRTADLAVDAALWTGLAVGAVRQGVTPWVWALAALAMIGSLVHFLQIIESGRKEKAPRATGNAFLSSMDSLSGDGDPSVLVWIMALVGYPGYLLVAGAVYMLALWVFSVRIGERKPDAEWKKQLTPEQYRVCRLGGTERAGSGKYVHTKDKGMYKCSNCGLELFSSDTKFDSGSGWPSFWSPADRKNVKFIENEVRCAGCDAHLGHVFEDGPAPTGQRYCINSVSLDLEKAS